jgi:glycosyltransferase involved in cell wall biosynthesis
MKVVFFANYMPDTCGAFFHDVAIAKLLQARGHIVNFVTTFRGKYAIRGEYRGIPWVYYTNAEHEMRAADVWSSPHFPTLKIVRRLNGKFHKPLIVTMHFGENLDELPYQPEWAEFLWVISNHITNTVRTRIGTDYHFKTLEPIRPIMIENEVKFQERGTPPPGKYVTLINANILKGLPLFIEIATRMPNIKFMGVRPYYNKINVPENIPNIKWIDVQEDIRDVMKQTRILLVPSLYESWGRVAFEAMYNGIPVLHTKPMDGSNPANTRPSGSTQGMCEWIGNSQFMLDYNNLQDWITTIRHLSVESEYQKYSKQAYDTAYGLNIFKDVEKIESKMFDYGTRFAPAPTPGNKAVVQVPTPSLQVRMPLAGGGMPLRGGRFSLRR